MLRAVPDVDPTAGERPTRRTADALMSRRSALALLGASALVPLQACSGPSSSPPVAAGAGPGEALHLLSLQEITLPSEYSPEKLPYSIQFVGRHVSEPVLCRIVQAYARHPSVDAV